MKEKRSGTPKTNRNNKKKSLMYISHYKDCLSISSFQDATVYVDDLCVKWILFVLGIRSDNVSASQIKANERIGFVTKPVFAAIDVLSMRHFHLNDVFDFLQLFHLKNTSSYNQINQKFAVCIKHNFLFGILPTWFASIPRLFRPWPFVLNKGFAGAISPLALYIFRQ